MIVLFLVHLFLLSLALGLYPNVILGNFSFYLFDIAVIIIFFYSCTLFKYRNTKVDFTILALVLYFFVLLLINTKFLLEVSSFLYLVRLFIYLATYPFFSLIFSKYTKKLVNTFLIYTFLSLVINLVVFYIYPYLNVLGFDPHKNRIYGQLLDPNYYAVGLSILIFVLLNIKYGHIKLNYLNLFLAFISIILSQSRLGLIAFFIVVIFSLKKFKQFEYFYILLGGIMLAFLNFNFLSRFLFLEGNFDSFFYRILDFVGGVIIFNQNSFPFGFNNIKTNVLFLNSSANNSASYFDFFVFNLLLTGGVGLIIAFSFVLAYFKKVLNSNYLKILFLLIFLSFGMNIFFHPYFLLIISLALGNLRIISRLK